MNAREEILGRVRAALAGVEPVADLPQAPRVPVVEHPALVDRFCARVADYRAVVERCSEPELAKRVAAAVAGGRAVVPVGLDLDVPGAVAGDALTATDLDTVATVVTTATVAVAETGTIVLDHGPGQGRRALSLVPDRHVCIVREGQVVADVPDAIAALDPTGPLTWISGPSATSDIELDRVEGVHGPRNLHVIVVSES